MSNDESADETRPRGVLSDADRKYLQNREEYSRQAAHVRQEAIVERTRNAILDFAILYQQLDPRDLKSLMRASVEVEGRQQANVENSAPDLVAFLYRHFDHEGSIEQVVADGIARAVWSDGWSATVDVDVDIDRGERIGTLADQPLEDLDDEALEQLRLAGEITSDEYAEELIRRKMETADSESVREMRRQAAQEKDAE